MSDQISIRVADGDLKLSPDELLKEELDEEADELGMSTAAMCRMYISIGRKLADQYDPKQIHKQKPHEGDPLGELIKSKVPVGKEEAKELDEIQDSVENEVEERIWDVLIESDDITRERGAFYR